MPIIIDSREKKELRKWLFLRGIRYKVAALPTGDYLFYNKDNPKQRVLIERKNIGDLVSSYIDGRLKSQFKRMAEEPFPILLVTGTIKDLRGKLPFKPDERLVEKVLAEAVIRYGFRSIIWIVGGFKEPKTEGLLFAVNALKELANNNLDNIPDKKIVRKGNPSISTIKILLNIPSNVAEALLIKFGTVRTIIDATDKQLLSVEGVGITRVKRIREILDGNFNKLSKKETPKANLSTSTCSRCGTKKIPVRFSGKIKMICTGCPR